MKYKIIPGLLLWLMFCFMIGNFVTMMQPDIAIEKKVCKYELYQNKN